MPEPRRYIRRWDLSPEKRDPSETIRPPERSRAQRDTLPDIPQRRPTRPAQKTSTMRPRRARGGVTEIDASSHRDDPRREK